MVLLDVPDGFDSHSLLQLAVMFESFLCLLRVHMTTMRLCCKQAMISALGYFLTNFLRRSFFSLGSLFEENKRVCVSKLFKTILKI